IEELQPVLQRLVGASLLKVEVGPGELVVHVPRGAFQQVLLNLVINARDAMEGESGMLRVDVCSRGKDEERMIVLEVADRGCGIEESALQRIFEPFYTTKSTGTGLGLSTVRDIVEQYQGTITVSSKVGEGTTFRIAWPAHALKQITADILTNPRVPPLVRRRILLVDDDDLVRGATGSVLRSAGFEVVGAADGLEALSLLEHDDDFDAVISDVSMPGMDGHELT